MQIDVYEIIQFPFQVHSLLEFCALDYKEVRLFTERPKYPDKGSYRTTARPREGTKTVRDTLKSRNLRIIVLYSTRVT